MNKRRSAAHSDLGELEVAEARLELDDGAVELGDVGGGAAETVLATSGARPDLEGVVARADAQLGAAADVLAGGPQSLLDGLEDRLGGRAVAQITWAM